jgi:hypothetical protein
MMQCGTCERCGQVRRLGYTKRVRGEDLFMCGACIDRYCNDSDEDDEMTPAPCVDEDMAKICGRMGVPEKLSLVPAGQLQRNPLRIAYGDDLKNQDTYSVISDPDSNYFMGHGAEGVWPAAKLLTRYLLTLPLEGVTMLELGAGCGLPGIAAARRGAHVVMTDLPWVLPLTGYNVDANFDDTDPQRPKLASLQWGCEADAASITTKYSPDLVVGADVVYRDEELKALFATISTIGCREVILSVVQREAIMSDFAKRVGSFGWQVELLGSEDRIGVVRLITDLYSSGGA